MIKSFGSEETEKIYNGIKSKKLPNEIQKNARRKLIMIDSAIELKDLRIPPGNKLEKLKGNLSKYYSIRINDQWRIVFIWSVGNKNDVEIKDYHK